MTAIDTRACAWCGGSLEGRRVDASYCGDACRHAAWRARKHATQAKGVSESSPSEETASNGFRAAAGTFPWQRLRFFRRRRPAIREQRDRQEREQ